MLDRAMQVILQVLAHARQIMNGPYSVLLDLIGWPYSRKKQQLRRINRAPADNDLTLRPQYMPLPPLRIFDAYGASALHKNARGLRPW